ncbi:MAG: hypothetical protein GEU75_04050 [Dehalococcoidia bacterium]|nr:hypothetical protein [Dehalococcoidia bacterium]
MSIAPSAETTEPRDESSASLSRLVTLVATAAAVFILGFAIASYANTGFYTRYWADDYCIAAHLNDKGLLGAQAYWFNNWTGRFGSVFLSNFMPWIGLGAMPFYGPVLIVSLYAATIWACHQAGRLVFDSRSLLTSSLVASVIVFGYLSLMPDRDLGLYWLAGGTNYSAPLVLLSLNAGIIAWGLRSAESRFRAAVVAAFLVAFISSGFAETFIVWQLALIFTIGLLVQRFGSGIRQDRLMTLLSAALIGGLIATMIVVLTPGNAARQVNEGPAGGITYAIQSSLIDAFQIFGELLVRPETLIAAAIMLLFAGVHTARQPDIQSLGARQVVVRCAVTVVVTYILLLATFAPGYYFLAQTPPDRALAMGAVSVILGAMCLGYLLGRAIGPSLARLEAQPRLLTPLVILAVLLMTAVALPPALREFGRTDELSAYASAWDRRDKQLTAAAEANVRDLTVPLLAHSSGFELRPDPTVWINRCAAFYYGLRSIVAE